MIGPLRRRESILPSRTIDNYRRLSYRIATPRPPVGIVVAVGYHVVITFCILFTGLWALGNHGDLS